MLARYSSAIVTGSATTFFLFFVMQSLIAIQPGVAGAERSRHTLALADVREDTDTRPLEYEPLAESIKELPEAPPHPEAEYDGPTPVGIPPMSAPLPRGTGEGIGYRMNDGPLASIVRVQPAYPAQPLSRGIEGWVLVEFDVRPDGSVANAFVVESSNRSFERSALSAVHKFRFKPAVVDGVAQTTTGLQNLFRFEISED